LKRVWDATVRGGRLISGFGKKLCNDRVVLNEPHGLLFRICARSGLGQFNSWLNWEIINNPQYNYRLLKNQNDVIVLELARVAANEPLRTNVTHEYYLKMGTKNGHGLMGRRSLKHDATHKILTSYPTKP